MAEKDTTQDDATAAALDSSNQVTFGTVTTTTIREESSSDDVLAPLPGTDTDASQNDGLTITTTTMTEDIPAATDDNDNNESNSNNDNTSTPFSPAAADSFVEPKQPPTRRRPTLVREDNVARLDIATGMATRRRQSIRQVTASKPANRWSKIAARLNATAAAVQASEESEAIAAQEQQENGAGDDNNVDNGCDENHGKTKRKQFRIRSTNSNADGKISFDMYAQRPIQVFITEYLHWTFKATFGEVILISFVWFMLLSIIFALFVFWVESYQPECLVDGNDGKAYFMDAFHLSWTTLSTVGYGVIYPNIASEQSRCIGINILMALESFVGVLFGGLTGAIIFGKVARIQSIAQVLFSHPICVRYGYGVSPPKTKKMREAGDSDDDDDNDDDETDEAAAMKHLQCPILEFRLVNELSNQAGGEIMNATLHVVGTTLAAQSEEDVISERHRKKRSAMRNSIIPKVAGTAKFATKTASMTANNASKTIKKTGAALLGVRKSATKATGSMIQKLNKQLMRSPRESTSANGGGEDEDEEPFSERELEREVEKEFQARLEKEFESAKDQLASLLDPDAKRSVAVDEGTGSLAPRRIYHPLMIETDSHPFFKRVWTIRHVLDATSPLLSMTARRMIDANGGFWPQELTNYSDVRKHLNFHEIIVSFSGTANASGSSVYAQKVYDYVDVNIGYSFASVLAFSEKGGLVVDHELLNDVHEQYGGGAEPFTNISGEPVGNVEHMAQLATAAAMTAAETATAATKAAAEGVKGAAVHTRETAYQTTQDGLSATNIVPDELEVVVDEENPV
jgi:hypothetical protein